MEPPKCWQQQVAPEQWRTPESFRALLLKNPKVLDLSGTPRGEAWLKGK